MPFNPEDFLKLAEQLYKDRGYQHVEEAAFRTSISRAYYATFLRIREVIREILSRTYIIDYFEEVARTGRIHSCIKNLLGGVDRYMGSIYGRLLFLRRRSDYDLRSSISYKDVEEALGIAKRIREMLTKLYAAEIDKFSNIVLRYYSELKGRRY